MKKLKVLIAVRGGIAHVVACPENIEVDLRDFDNNELDENDLRENYKEEFPEPDPQNPTEEDYISDRLTKDFTPQEIEEAERGYEHDPEPQGTEKELAIARICKSEGNKVGAVMHIKRAFPGFNLYQAKNYYDTKL